MELDDQFIAVPIGTKSADFHGVVKLNSTAADIFKLLEDEITEQEITELLLKTYNGQENDITGAVHRIINELRKKTYYENNVWHFLGLPVSKNMKVVPFVISTQGTTLCLLTRAVMTEKPQK